MKILYFPRFQNEKGIELYTFLVSNMGKLCHYLNCQKYINIQSKYINVQKVYQVHHIFKKYINIYKKQYSNNFKQVFRYSKSISSTSIF